MRTSRLLLTTPFLTTLLAILVVAVSGCASKVVTQLKKTPRDDFAQQFQLSSEGNGDFSPRTTLTLRAFDLEKQANTNTASVLVELQKTIRNVENQDMLYAICYAFSEIAYLEARKWEQDNPKFALELHFAALLHSYQYLFDPKFKEERNPYDPQFRNVCLIYNNSLQRMLRLLGNEYELSLDPGYTYAIQSLEGTCNVTCSMLTDDWKGEEIEKFKFADDYEIKGMQNEYKQYGLGVPLIAMRKKGVTNSPLEKYYPPGLCFPVTAFLRPDPPHPHNDRHPRVNCHPRAGGGPEENIIKPFHEFLNPDENINEILLSKKNFVTNQNFTSYDGTQFHAVLELYDSTISERIQVAETEVPLESDLTTPLAYFLSNPRLNNLSTIGLLRPDALLISRILPSHAEDLKEEEKTAKTKTKILPGNFVTEKENEEDINPIKHASFHLKSDERVDITLVAHLAQWSDNDVTESKGPNDSLYGIYMMQPYDPNKIPVVMVHGLWSSPMTWMEMFHNLRALPEIRDNYQFWFYFYPSAQPFWISAAQLRSDLEEIRNTINSGKHMPPLDDMILVGHSMGGLISRMQTIESGNEIWNLVSRVPLEQLDETPQVKEDLKKWFYFSPNPAVSRVITIATPFRGSDYSNNFTQWISNKAIQIPQTIANIVKDVTLNNKKAFDENSLMNIETSVQSLAPSNPLFPILLSSDTLPGVQFNNMIGVVEHTGLKKHFYEKGDGIVAYKSAKIAPVHSEIEVPAHHSYVHTHPKSITEVRRILLENVKEKQNPGPQASSLHREAKENDANGP